jgi:hypothetical protein
MPFLSTSRRSLDSAVDLSLTTIFKISEFLKRVQFESSKGAFLAKFQIEAIF